MSRPVELYVRFWREDPAEGNWAIIIANLKFAIFNLCVAVCLMCVVLVVLVTGR